MPIQNSGNLRGSRWIVLTGKAGIKTGTIGSFIAIIITASLIFGIIPWDIDVILWLQPVFIASSILSGYLSFYFLSKSIQEFNYNELFLTCLITSLILAFTFSYLHISLIVSWEQHIYYYTIIYSLVLSVTLTIVVAFSSDKIFS